MPRTRILHLPQWARTTIRSNAATAAFRALARQPQDYLAAAQGGVISAGAMLS
jgi:hypothetical protein